MRVSRRFSVLAMVACAGLMESVSADRISEALASPVSITSENAYLHDVLQQLSDSCQINIVVDNRVVAPVGVEDSKYVSNGKIEFLNVKDVSLREVLNAILHPMKLDYTVQSGYLWVSTTANIRHEAFEDLVTRSYHLPSLLVPDVNADTRSDAPATVDVLALLARVVPDMIEPVTGRTLSYVRYNIETKALVVHNTPANLKLIEKLLGLISPTPAEESSTAASPAA